MGGLNWSDAEEIAILLSESRPKQEPLLVRFTDLQQWVCELEDFDDHPQGCNEGILEAIQMAWLEEWQDSHD